MKTIIIIGVSYRARCIQPHARLTFKVSEGYSEEQIANHTNAEDVADAVFEVVTDG
jgi:hypothetical protein